MILRRLAELRQDHDLTQADIARILNTSQPQYNRYETGERDLPVSHLITLADYYQISTDYILGRTDETRYVRKQNG